MEPSTLIGRSSLGTAPVVWTLGRRRPQEQVVTRQQLLQEVVLVQYVVSVQVEIVYEEDEVFR